MVLVHEGLIEVNFRPLQAAIGVAVRSFLTQVASSCEDNIVAFFQGRTSFPGAIRKAPSLQRAPQGYGRDIGLMSLEEILPQLPHTDTLARSIPGRYFLRVLPLLIKMEFEVHDQLFHGWSKVFPLKRHSYDLTVDVEHGHGCRYRYQNVHIVSDSKEWNESRGSKKPF